MKQVAETDEASATHGQIHWPVRICLAKAKEKNCAATFHGCVVNAGAHTLYLRHFLSLVLGGVFLHTIAEMVQRRSNHKGTSRSTDNGTFPDSPLFSLFTLSSIPHRCNTTTLLSHNLCSFSSNSKVEKEGRIKQIKTKKEGKNILKRKKK